MKKKQPLLIVAGPTATGKSDAAVELAARMNGAVISADSMQVYRGMDIGSAKITAEEMRGIPHYLIDCVDPSESWNVVRFQKHAREAVREIAGSGRLPILCGGTGFYIQALLYDVDFTEMEENTALRESLQKIADEKGPQALHAMLAEKDPASAAAIHPGNVKRVIRALEFAGGTGQSIADHNLEQRAREAAYDAIPRDSTSMQGIGYKQLYGFLEGEYSLEEAVRLIKRDTRHFAKRQLTWFRRERDVRWVDLDQFPSREAVWDHMRRTAEEHYLSQV